MADRHGLLLPGVVHCHAHGHLVCTLACTWTVAPYLCTVLVLGTLTLTALGQYGYGYLGSYPLVKPQGSNVPFTGYHPISLLFIYELVDW